MRRHSVLIRTAVPGLLLGLGGALLSGCSSSSGTSSAESTTALCTSVGSLQQSVTKLKEMQVSENGVAAMRDQLVVVKADLNKVLADAQAQYGPQADQIRADVAALKGVAGQVKEDPSADTLTTVRPALTTLVADVQALGDQVADRCS